MSRILLLAVAGEAAMIRSSKLKCGLICGLIGIFGCESKIGPSDVLGAYAVQYPYGTEQLRVFADGRYEQYFASLGETNKLINSGNWELQSRDRLLLVLNSPVIVDHGFGKQTTLTKREGAYWPLPVTRSLGGDVHLPVNEDQNFVFVRIK